MKTKVLAMLLAVVMIACLIPFSASAATVKTVYVSATGDDTTGTGTEAAPYATIYKALNDCFSATFQPGDSIEVIVTGSVQAGATNYSGLFCTASNAVPKVIVDTAGKFVPVTVKGSTENAADTTIVITTKDATGSTIRKYNSLNLTLKNLTMKTATAEYLAISAHLGTITFDNVKFDNSGFPATGTTAVGTGWIMDCGNNNNPNSTAYLTGLGYSSDNKGEITSGMTFKNGDYTNIKVVGLAYNSAQDKLNSAGKYHGFLTIAAGATMGDIIVANNNSIYTDFLCTIEEGATVASVTAFGSAVNDESVVADITINNKGVVTVNGVAVGGGGTGAVTADASSIVFFSALALISLAGVVVLKKQTVR